MALFKTITSKASLKRALAYINRERKTDEKETIPYYLKDGINCNPDTAYEEMIGTKVQYGKKGGREYIHNILSFSEEESEFITPDKALEIMKELINKTPEFQGFESALSVHLEHNKIHVHCITNSVSQENGKKTRWNQFSLKKLQARLTDIINKHNEKNLQKLVNALEGNGKKSHTKALEQAFNRDSWILNIADKIIASKQKARTQDEFISLLQDAGINCFWTNRKHIIFTPIGDNNPKHKVRAITIQEHLLKYGNFEIDLSKEGLTNEFTANKANAATIRQSERIATETQRAISNITGSEAKIRSCNRNNQGSRTGQQPAKVKTQRIIQSTQHSANNTTKTRIRTSKSNKGNEGR